MTYNSMPPTAGAAPVNGTLILVLGILSLLVCGVFGPIAMIMGNNAMATLNAGAGDESQRGLVNAGRICGIIGTVFLVFQVIGVLIWLLAVVGLIASGAASAPPR